MSVVYDFVSGIIPLRTFKDSSLPDASYHAAPSMHSHASTPLGLYFFIFSIHGIAGLNRVGGAE